MNKLLKNVLQFYGTIGVPVIYAVGLWLVTQSNTLDVGSNWQVTGLGIGVLGIVLWIVSYLHLGKHFGVLPRAQTRVRTGVYAVIRHPMYKGIFMTYFGLAIAARSEAGLVYTSLVLFPLLYFRAGAEDKLLKG